MRLDARYESRSQATARGRQLAAGSASVPRRARAARAHRRSTTPRPRTERVSALRRTREAWGGFTPARLLTVARPGDRLALTEWLFEPRCASTRPIDQRNDVVAEARFIRARGRSRYGQWCDVKEGARGGTLGSPTFEGGARGGPMGSPRSFPHALSSCDGARRDRRRARRRRRGCRARARRRGGLALCRR